MNRLVCSRIPLSVRSCYGTCMVMACVQQHSLHLKLLVALHYKCCCGTFGGSTQVMHLNHGAVLECGAYVSVGTMWTIGTYCC